MRTFKVDFRRFGLGWLAPSASVALLAISLVGRPAMASPVFVGLTGVETRLADNDAAQVIEFKADLPFHYQMQILDKNRVVFRLYNVQMAGNLLTPEGSVNLLAGGAVQSAMVRPVGKRPTTGDTYEEIVFRGPGLGDQKIQVLGATELPLVSNVSARSSTTPSTVKQSRLDALGQKSIPPLRPVKFSSRGASVSLPNLSVLEKRASSIPPRQEAADIRQATAMAAVAGEEAKPKAENVQPGMLQPRINIETQASAKNQLPTAALHTMQPSASAALQTDPQAIQARPGMAARGPQIESLTRVPVRGFLPLETPNVVPSREQVAEPVPDQVVAPEQPSVPSNETSFVPEAPPQSLIALPRYHGGAAPIQAVTLDANGNPVRLRPKNEPIQELPVGKANGGFNTLFQAETPELSQPRTVDRLMAESLALFHDKHYQQAEKLIGEALQMDPANADLYAALGEVQMQLGQAEPATQSYQRASQLSPKQYGQPYAQMLVQNGKRPEAIRVLTELNQQHPKQVQIVYMLGTLHEELGQVSQALPYLKQAAQLHPASADIQYNLGLAYELAGDHQQAEKHYRHALDLGPAATDAAKALERVRN